MVASSATGRSQSTHAARSVCCSSTTATARICATVLALPNDAGLEVAPAGGRVEKSGNHQNAKIAPENHHGHAGGDQSHVSEYEEERAQKQLVGNRVKVLAQHGPLLQNPGQSSVERVGQSCSDKKREGQSELAFQDGSDQKRGQADAHRSSAGSAWCASG